MSIELEELIRMPRLTFINWLIQKKQIIGEMKCTHCNQFMSLKERKNTIDEYSWRCCNIICKHRDTYKTIRINSFLASFKIDILLIYKYCIYWSNFMKQVDILKYVNMDRKIAIKIRKELIGNIKRYFVKNPIRLGGPGAIVQVDETKLNFNVKSHRGRGPKDAVWALCIVDTTFSPARGYVQIVTNRTKSVLIPIIKMVVLQGSIIHSDDWQSYNALQEEGFSHQTVCHKYHFVEPTTGVHTQHVESWNNKLKLAIKERKGIIAGQREGFLLEFMLYQFFKNDDPFNALLELIKID